MSVILIVDAYVVLETALDSQSQRSCFTVHRELSPVEAVKMGIDKGVDDAKEDDTDRREQKEVSLGSLTGENNFVVDLISAYKEGCDRSDLGRSHQDTLNWLLIVELSPTWDQSRPDHRLRRGLRFLIR